MHRPISMETFLSVTMCKQNILSVTMCKHLLHVVNFDSSRGKFWRNYWSKILKVFSIYKVQYIRCEIHWCYLPGFFLMFCCKCAYLIKMRDQVFIPPNFTNLIFFKKFIIGQSFNSKYSRLSAWHKACWGKMRRFGMQQPLCEMRITSFSKTCRRFIT